MKSARDRRQRLLAPLVPLVPALEALRRVPGGDLEQVGLGAALGREELHPPSTPVGEHLRERAGALRLDRQEHLLGRRVLLVVETEEGRHRLLVRELLLPEGIGARVLQLAATHGEHGDDEVRAFPVEAEHVAVRVVGHQHALLLQAALHGHQLIAQPRRVLEAQRAGGLAHALAQALGELPLAALQELDRVLHAQPVLLGRDLIHARRRAAVDLVQDARALAMVEDVIAAGRAAGTSG